MSERPGRLSGAVTLAAAVGLLVSAPGLAAQAKPDDEPRPPATAPSGPRFEEVSEAAGVAFVHSTRSFGDRHKAQVLEMFTEGGAAVAVGDFDGDGFEDLFLTDSDEGRSSHLMRNLYGETGELRFEDVTAAAGVGGGNDPRSIVSDALWLDFDDDGRLDLLVARFGTPILYRNLGSPPSPSVPLPPHGGERDAPAQTSRGEGVWFEDVSKAVGLTKFGNTIAAIAFDYDGDGWLDLLLGNYFRPVNLLDLDTPKVLPNNLDDADNGGGVTLWRNVPAGTGDQQGAGGRKFVEVTQEAGLGHHTGWSLDLGHADLDNDGDQDLYVAGDYGTDRLFMNDGPGPEGTTFTDVTEKTLGFDTKKGMNVDMADYDRNGWLDIYVTNITDEYMRECNMLWHNAGDGTFLELASETGTCDTDWGWAAKFGDFDNDGWEDLFVVDGLRSAGEENYIPLLLQTIITPEVDFSDVNSYPDIGERTWSGYQPQRLFHNLGNGTFREMAAEAGVDNRLDGRGIGVGDFDRDGRLDLVQTNARQQTLLYRNVTEPAGHWIELTLEGAGVRAPATGEEGAETRPPGSNRHAVGARVEVTLGGGAKLLREVNGGNGYASQSTTRVHVGLGDAKTIERIEIRWPSGRVEVLEAADGKPPVPIDRSSRIVEGRGVAQ